MQTANLMSHLMMQSQQPEPGVGMPATVSATVISIRRFKTGSRAGQVCEVTVQEDSYRRTDTLGMSDCQTYEYERNPNGSVRTFKVGKDGRCKGLSLGHRERYYDYSF